MNIIDFTNKKAVKILSTQSRRTDISPIELCNVHFEMGKYLGYQIVEDFELTDKTIQHVQGIKTGFELIEKNNIIIFTLMRAGLYAAEGIRSIFEKSTLYLYNNDEIIEIDLTDKIVIIVDAVVNTGKTLIKTLGSLSKFRTKRIIVATLVLQNETLSKIKKYSDIDFYILRISSNKYVGKGGTDTGNRLFNTL